MRYLLVAASAHSDLNSTHKDEETQSIYEFSHLNNNFTAPDSGGPYRSLRAAGVAS